MDRPNILFIMADQYRWDYLGYAGAGFVRTPNLDRLAARGVAFTHCYTNCPVCAPARIALATGLQPFRTGALDNQSYLPAGITTYYQRLRDQGYRVGCVGKLDLAKPDPYNGRHGDRPCVYGWGFTHPEECEGKMHAGMHPSPQGPYGFWLQDQNLYDRFYRDYRKRSEAGWIKGVSHDSVLPAEAFEDCYVGRRAARWIETIADDFPWHLFVSFVGPHDPFDPPEQYADHYRDAEVPEAIEPCAEGKPRWVRQRELGLSPDEVAHTRRQYCGSIEAIDRHVGLMVQALEERGMLENTIILFSSDHGEMLGDHGCYTKTLPYDSSIRIPLFVCGPGVKPGIESEALIELIDLAPTVCDLAGVPMGDNLDARSFLPILQGNGEAHRESIVSCMRNWRLIRTRTHKYVQNYNEPDELYEMAEDPDERVNRAADNPDLCRELQANLVRRYLEDKWLR